MTIEQLQDRLAEINEASNAILMKADAEKRDPSVEEAAELDSLISEFKTTDENLTRMKSVAEQAMMLSRSSGRQTTPEKPGREAVNDDEDDDDASPVMTPKKAEPRIRVTEAFEHDRSRWGWRSYGEYAMAVRRASMNGGEVDRRLAAKMAPTTYGSEGSGADGGHAIPPDFRSEIMQKVAGEESLLGRTDQLQTSGNSITVPIDSTTPWQTTGGIQAFWDGEGALMTQSKPSLEQETIKLNKLQALIPVTDEMLDDAPALDSYLRRKAPQKIDFKVNYGLLQGNGVGMPLGIINSPSLITVADANGGYIEPVDIYNMWSRMYAPFQSEAIWLINQNVYPELLNLNAVIKNVAGTENVGGGPVFLPPGGLSGSPYATLMGRPIVPTQACKPLNTVGDILFVHMKSYMSVLKSSGIKADTSIHLYFDYAMTAYRFILRMGGQPWWKATIDPSSGSSTLGWAIALDTRT